MHWFFHDLSFEREGEPVVRWRRGEERSERRKPERCCWQVVDLSFQKTLKIVPPIMTLVDIRYDRNKLAITATGTPNWIEELEDDFEDMEEDIETYRCTCKWLEIGSKSTIRIEQRIVCVSCPANNRETWSRMPKLGHNEAFKGTKGSFLLKIEAPKQWTLLFFLRT